MEEVLIPDNFITQAASLVQSQLGPHGVELVGGTQWWQWRRPEIPLKAELIEMKTDQSERRAAGKAKSERIMLYVHGGAYYFGSTGEHRYQMQRHARKLKAQLLAPKYRLAPQFPFPCGLHDCLASYLYLIHHNDPSTILLAGDSAGGGMVISMLVTLRDQGIPLPAGAILLSPWVDLTHSFPSVAGEGPLDYIPANGFHHKPSMAWPPPNATDLQSLKTTANNSVETHTVPEPRTRIDQKPNDRAETEAARGYSVRSLDATPGSNSVPMRGNKINPKSSPKSGHNLSIELDGKLIEIQDQIQMYAANHLLAHPLVSPVMQSSLGGLPPLLIQVGGGELLRDEQIYLAHKAANPALYPPPDSVLDEFDPDRHFLHKYGPTHVQLQVWDDLCHVTHTLSFTRPAKFMYRSVAQFGAWALARAQSKPMTIMDDDDFSIISTDSSSEKSMKMAREANDSDTVHSGRADPSALDGEPTTPSISNVHMRAHTITTPSGEVGKAGDPIPPFVNHMIRQRVDRHGIIYPLSPPAELPSLQVNPSTIGVIKPGPVRKWIAKKSDWDIRYAKEKRHVQKTRLKDMKQGYDEFSGETPPPTALAGRRQKGMEKQKQRKGKSWALAMWSGWGSKHDESTIDRKKKVNRRPTQSVVLPEAGMGIAAVKNPAQYIETIEKQGDTTAATGSPESAAPLSSANHRNMPTSGTTTAGTDEAILSPETTKVEGSENTYLSSNNARPHNGVVAYPFKLRNMPNASLSTATLDSSKDQVRPMGGIHGTYQSSHYDRPSPGLGDDKSLKSKASVPSTPGGWIDGSGEPKEIGGHAWISGREDEKQSPSQPHTSHDLNNSHETRNASSNNEWYDKDESQGGDEVGGQNWLAGGRAKEENTTSEEAQRAVNGNDHSANNSAPLSADNQTTDDEGGHEPGGHNWIVGKSKKAKDRNTNLNAGDIGREAQTSRENGPTKKTERPAAQTFVTARETL